MSTTRHRTFRSLAVVLLGALPFVAVACGSSGGSAAKPASGSTSSTSAASSAPVDLRLGYFPNVTHAPALVGDRGRALREEPRQERHARSPSRSTPAPTSSTAIYADALDASFIGPGPSISAFQKSNGEAIRIVSGAASGGAFLVVKPSITKRRRPQGQEDRHARSSATRRTSPCASWLKKQGFTTDTSGGGDVSIVPAGQRA